MLRRTLLLAALFLPGTLAAAAELDFPGATTDSWHGHERRSFRFEGADAWVVVPEKPLPGDPWSWCLMFPDAFTERCAAPGLVARGFHHAFLDVGNSFGSPAAVAKLARFHDELVRRGLAPRPALIGISRGSLSTPSRRRASRWSTSSAMPTTSSPPTRTRWWWRPATEPSAARSR